MARRKRKFGVEPPKPKPKGGVPNKSLDPFSGWKNAAAAGPLGAGSASQSAAQAALAESVIRAFLQAQAQTGAPVGAPQAAPAQVPQVPQAAAGGGGGSWGAPQPSQAAQGGGQDPLTAALLRDFVYGGMSPQDALLRDALQGSGFAGMFAQQDAGRNAQAAPDAPATAPVPQDATARWQNPRVPVGTSYAIDPNAMSIIHWTPQNWHDATTIDPMRLLSAVFRGIPANAASEGIPGGGAPQVGATAVNANTDTGFVPHKGNAASSTDVGFVPAAAGANDSVGLQAYRQRLLDLKTQAAAEKKKKQAKLGTLPAANQSGYLGGGPAEAGLAAISPTFRDTGYPLGTDVGGNAQALMNLLQTSTSPMVQQWMASLASHAPGQAPGATGSDANNTVDAYTASQNAKAAARAAALRQAYLNQMGSLSTALSGAQAEGTAAADRARAAVEALGSPYQNIQLAHAQDQSNPLAAYMRGLGTGTQQVDATMGLINSMNQSQNAGLDQLSSNLNTMNQNARTGQLSDIALSREAFIQNLAKQKAEQELALKNYYSSRGVKV